MKTFLKILAILALAAPAHAGRTLTASAAANAAVGDTIYVSFDLPTSGQPINLAAIRCEWNEGVATFHSWTVGGCVFSNPLWLPCNFNSQGKMKFSTTGQGTGAAGHVATMKMVAVGTGTLTIAVGNGCPTWEDRPTFYYNGIIVPTDATVPNVVVSVTSGSGGCSPNPCELEKAGHLGVRVRAPREHWTDVAPSPWSKVKGLYK